MRNLKISISSEKIVLILILIIAITLGGTFYSLHKLSDYGFIGITGMVSYENEVISSEVNVQVGDYLRFDKRTDKLRFGTIPPGGTNIRYIVLKNHNSIPMRVNFRAEGPCARWLTISDSFIRLKSNEEKEIKITMRVPKGTGKGEYFCKTFFEFRETW